MKTLGKTLLALSMATMLILTSLAEPQKIEQGFTVEKELIVSGTVQQVLEAEHLATLKTSYGAEIDVPLDALPPWGTEQAGYQELEPGLTVTARMHPGLVSVTPAAEDKIWIIVDGDEFVRLYPRDLDEDLFHDDERAINGNPEISLAEMLMQEVHDNPVINY